MIDGAGAVGPRAWRGMLLHARTEDWARELIHSVRKGDIQVCHGSPVHVISHYQDPDGTSLHIDTAAIELINLLRPTVAVARYITFAATAMENFPDWKGRLSSGNEDLIKAFVQEVRWYYPFFPAVGGRALEAFEWKDLHFKKGAWVLLDLYGTNHDPRIWSTPQKFHPERFLSWEGNPYTLIPQGGGDFYTGHRCPGEWITIELVRLTVRELSLGMDYYVPMQDLSFNLSRMPAIPNSRFILNHVKKSNAATAYFSSTAHFDSEPRS